MAALEEVGGFCLSLLASWTPALSGLPREPVLTNVAFPTVGKLLLSRASAGPPQLLGLPLCLLWDQVLWVG